MSAADRLRHLVQQATPRPWKCGNPPQDEGGVAAPDPIWRVISVCHGVMARDARLIALAPDLAAWAADAAAALVAVLEATISDDEIDALLARLDRIMEEKP